MNTSGLWICGFFVFDDCHTNRVIRWCKDLSQLSPTSVIKFIVKSHLFSFLGLLAQDNVETDFLSRESGSNRCSEWAKQSDHWPMLSVRPKIVQIMIISALENCINHQTSVSQCHRETSLHLSLDLDMEHNQSYSLVPCLLFHFTLVKKFWNLPGCAVYLDARRSVNSLVTDNTPTHALCRASRSTRTDNY